MVLISNRTPKPPRALGSRANTMTPDRRLSAQSSAQWTLDPDHPKRGKSRWNAGLQMARPGLEPGTPRFSVVRSESSNQPETPAKRGRRVRGPRRRHTRKFASFLPDSGDEWRLVSHWNWRRAARTAPDVAATPEGLIGDAGAVGDELLRIGHGITPPLSWLSTDSLRGVAEAEHRAIPEMVPSGR